MKAFSPKTFFSILAISCSVLIIFSLSSCARKLTFANSTVAPAATGRVKIKKTKNGNYSIDVETKHLAPADKLSPPRRVYVVWMETEQNPVRNIGMIKSESGIFSNTLKGDLQATATSKPTSFFITAEDDGNTQYPGNEVVLRTR
jgi:hypothetical protein